MADRICRDGEGEGGNGPWGKGLAQGGLRGLVHKLLTLGCGPVGHGLATGQRALPEEGTCHR